MTTIHVTNPAAFTAHLRDRDFTVRHAAVRALAQRVPEAARFAREDAEDALHALTDGFNPALPTVHDRAVLAALDALDHPAATPIVTLVLTRAESDDDLKLAAGMLARWGAPGIATLRAALGNDQPPARRRAAAVALANQDVPSTDDVRAALIRIQSGVAEPTDAPPFDDSEAHAAYLALLAGPDAATVRRVAEAHGAKAFTAMSDGYASLNHATRVWLIEWSARLRSVRALQLLDENLTRFLETAPCETCGPGSPVHAERVATLTSIASLGPLAEALRPNLDRLTPDLLERHGDETLLAALSAARHAAHGEEAIHP